MATLVLQAAGQAAGGLLGPVGAIVGRAAGAIAGNAIDRQLFGERRTRVEGRIDDLTVQTSTEGNPIPRVYGRNRLAGTVIWATDFEEEVSESSAGGGKGGGPKVREYTYFASFAVGICEGPVARIGRIWADGEEIDRGKVTLRFYPGHQDQPVDPLIAAVEGVAPAYRGLVYAVFERLPIGEFGNRLPQLTFEVIRPIGILERRIKAVTMIPGATEFGYDPARVDRIMGPGEVQADNRHVGTAASDFDAALEELTQVCPNLERVALVVSWFGTDLRAGHCKLAPGVEAEDRATSASWSVAGRDRKSAYQISKPGGQVSYGGTPSDASVAAAIKAIKARGLKVVFYPFILMDVPPGNGLPDPYGAAAQAPYPWRGRISLDTAPGRAGSPDGTAAADAQVANFSAELRAMMLHYASLCASAGGVDAFLVGSELRGLTTIRGAAGFPFVGALSGLVDDVRGILGPGTKLSYAADWSEYFGHHTDGDVYFHLDPLWANPNVDFIGIDNYWPLSDWRDGEHLDASTASGSHDPDYLTSNVRGGEGFDWFYANPADRDAQVRTPIEDGAYGKDWVFRYKDLSAWWGNLHFNRTSGVEVTTPTAWQPGMKPVWFTEVGCPAVERGANQPNVFFDPKSAESALPHYSTGRRDDAVQRAYLDAIIGAFDPATSPDVDAHNPVSPVYGGRMVELSGIHAWTWDARPWPAFPQRTDIWSDGPNWERGHWLNGRLGGAGYGDLVRQLFFDWGYGPPEVSGVGAVFDGFVVSGPSSLRAVLEPLNDAVSAVGADTGVGIRFTGLDAPVARTFARTDFVDMGANEPLLSETRSEAFDLPVEMRIRYYDSGRAFRAASAAFRPREATARQIDEIQIPASLSDGLAAELAEKALAVRWAGRVTARFALPPSDLALMPGDFVRLELPDCSRDFIIEEVEDVGQREITARSLDRAGLTPAVVPSSSSPEPVPAVSAAPFAFALNLPVVDETVEPHLPWLAVYARPFDGPYGLWRQGGSDAFQLVRTVERAASVGQVVAVNAPDVFWRFDRGDTVDVTILNRGPSSVDEIDVLNGANGLAVNTSGDAWEVLQFQKAELIGERTYRLSNLLRGQLGTEDVAPGPIPVGASVALLDGTLVTIPTGRAEIGLPRTYRVGPLSEGVGGDHVTTFTFTPSGRGLSPFAPAHGRARRLPSGDIALSWIRRPRSGGDPWTDYVDAPLIEMNERYTLSILSLGSPVRTLTVGAPSFIYPLSDQLADLGAAPTQLSFRVAQLADGFGPGPFLEVSVDVEQS